MSTPEEIAAAQERLKGAREALRASFLALPAEIRESIQTYLKSPEFKAKKEKDIKEICEGAARLVEALKPRIRKKKG